MVKAEKGAYRCGICGLHYKEIQMALKCEEWCSRNRSCNVEITSKSLEASGKGSFRL